MTQLEKPLNNFNTHVRTVKKIRTNYAKTILWLFFFTFERKISYYFCNVTKITFQICSIYNWASRKSICTCILMNNISKTWYENEAYHSKPSFFRIKLCVSFSDFQMKEKLSFCFCSLKNHKKLAFSKNCLKVFYTPFKNFQTILNDFKTKLTLWKLFFVAILFANQFLHLVEIEVKTSFIYKNWQAY